MSSASDPKTVVTGYPAPPTAGTAYPYPAPPAHPARYYVAPEPSRPAPLYYSAPVYRSQTFNNLRRLFSIAIAVFLLVGAATFVIWLALRPRLPDFSVSSASVSSFNLSSSQQLSSDFDLTLYVRNPNKKLSIYYDRIGAAVLYRGEYIADTSLPPFYQGKGNITTVRARMAAVAEYLDTDVVKGIASDRAQGGGTVNFEVRVSAWVRFRSGAWRMRDHALRVYCEDVAIAFKNSTATVGSLVGPTKQCQVNL